MVKCHAVLNKCTISNFIVPTSTSEWGVIKRIVPKSRKCPTALNSRYYNTHLTPWYSVSNKNAWFERKFSGSTQKCHTQHASDAIIVIQHALFLVENCSSFYLNVLFFRNPHTKENEMTSASNYIWYCYKMKNLLVKAISDNFCLFESKSSFSVIHNTPRSHLWGSTTHSTTIILSVNRAELSCASLQEMPLLCKFP